MARHYNPYESPPPYVEQNTRHTQQNALNEARESSTARPRAASTEHDSTGFHDHSHPVNAPSGPFYSSPPAGPFYPSAGGRSAVPSDNAYPSLTQDVAAHTTGASMHYNHDTEAVTSYALTAYGHSGIFNAMPCRMDSDSDLSSKDSKACCALQ